MPILNPKQDGFVPELWVPAVMEPFTKRVVFGQTPVVSDQYTGEINQKGDTVHVGQVGKPTISAYDATTDINIEDVTITDTAMKIDQGQYFAFYVDDVAKVQTAGPFQDSAITQAASELAGKVDEHIAKIFKDEAGTKIGVKKVYDGRISGAGNNLLPFEALIQLQTALDAKNVPQDSRYVVIGPKFHAGLLHDERFTRADGHGSNDILLNGRVGRVLGFDVLVSHNVPVTANRELICAGYNGAISLATQINKLETMRAQTRFADIVRGLMIWGAKAFRPEALATMDVDYNTGA